MFLKKVAASLGFSAGFSIFIIVLNAIVYGLSSTKDNGIKIIMLIVIVFNGFIILNIKKPYICSSPLSAFKEGFIGFNNLIRNTVNFILLSVVYFVGVGPVSLIAKLTGKKFLDLKPTTLHQKSYWKENKVTKQKFEDYTRSF